MNYREFHPSPYLKPYIDHIWVDQFALAKENKRENIIPDGMVELVFNFGAPYKRGLVNSKHTQTINGSHFIGIKSQSHYVEVNKDMVTMGVRFKPGRFSCFSKIPAGELTDSCVSGKDIFGKTLTDLEHKIYHEKDVNAKVQLIDKFLLSNLKIDDSKNEFDNWLNSIYNNPQECSIGSLSNQKHVNYKQLERKFLQYLGITPKHFWKIVRFNHALKLWSCSNQSNYTELAYNAGYADQSHLIKEFKMFTSKSPGEYFQNETQLTKVIQNTINKQMSNLYNPTS